MHPPVITAYYGHRARKMLFGSATPREVEHYKAHKVYDGTSDSYIPAPPEVVAHWLGWQPEMITALSKLRTCDTHYHKITTQSWAYAERLPVAPDPSMKQRCGIVAFCDPCTSLLGMLGRSWHVLASSDLLQAVLLAYLQMTPEERARNQRDLYPTGLQHNCSGACSLAYTKHYACQVFKKQRIA